MKALEKYETVLYKSKIRDVEESTGQKYVAVDNVQATGNCRVALVLLNVKYNQPILNSITSGSRPSLTRITPVNADLRSSIREIGVTRSLSVNRIYRTTREIGPDARREGEAPYGLRIRLPATPRKSLQVPEHT